MNGQITEVQQLKTKANSKMGDHLGSIYFGFFFSFAMICRNIWQIYQILLLSWSFEKKNTLINQIEATSYSSLFSEQQKILPRTAGDGFIGTVSENICSKENLFF